MRVPLWLDISMHLLFSLFYSIHYLKNKKWNKKYLLGSFTIFALGALIDLDHRQFVNNFIKKISGGRISFKLPHHIIHICHTWQFALAVFFLCTALFSFGAKSLPVYIFASYFTHILIDTIGKPGPNPSNLFPAQIYHFLKNIFK